MKQHLNLKTFRPGLTLGLPLAALLVATACSNTDEELATDQRVEARITAGVGTLTRASGTTWSATDEVGIYVTDVTPTTEGEASDIAELYTNARYTIGSGAGTGSATLTAASEEEKIYFQSATEVVTFAAYCPYQADASSIAIHTEAAQTAELQPTIDYLYASGAQASKGAPTVAFTGTHQFEHILSQLSLSITLGDGFDTTTLPDDAVVTLGGLVHAGTLALTGAQAGRAVLDAEAQAVSDWDISQSYGGLIVLPQDLSAAPLELAITVGGQTFRNATSIAPNMQPGTAYHYNITVNLTGLVVSGSTIKDWTAGEGGSGEATL